MKKIVTIGLAMIVKNEEKTLPSLLPMLRGLFDQIVILDTGSNDNTLDLLFKYVPDTKYLVEEIPWARHFSMARNQSFSKMDTDLIMWLDADDELPTVTQQFIRSLRAKSLDEIPDGYHFDYVYVSHGSERPNSVLKRLQIVKKSAQPNWIFRIFEQLQLAEGSSIEDTEHPIIHRRDPALTPEKNQRNLELLELGLIEEPNSIHYLFFLGLLKFNQRQYASALENFNRFLVQNNSDPFIMLRKLQCHLVLKDGLFMGNYKKFKEFLPDWAEVNALEGFALEIAGNFEQAIECLTTAQKKYHLYSDCFSSEDEKKYWAGIIPGQHLINIYREQNKPLKVKEQKALLLELL